MGATRKVLTREVLTRKVLNLKTCPRVVLTAQQVLGNREHSSGHRGEVRLGKSNVRRRFRILQL